MPSANQTVIVTGAASGIGRAMALGLLGAGIDVAAVDRTAPALDTLAAEAKDKPGSVHTIHADLADPTSFERIVAATLDRSGRIDVLINNAGIGQASIRPDRRTNPIRFWEITPEQWQQLPRGQRHRADHDGARRAAAHAGRQQRPHHHRHHQPRHHGARRLPALRRQQGGGRGGDGRLSADLKDSGITSNVLVPGGLTNTGIVGDQAGDRSKMLQPEIMVPPLLWLVSEAAAKVNGRRFIAADWDTKLPAAQAAEKAGAPIAWMSIARMPIEPG